MRSIGRIVDWLVKASTLIGVVAVLSMIVHICLDVLLRNVFRAPIPATSVIVANYHMAIIAFLPLALTEKLDQHVSVDVLFSNLPKTVQVWLLRAVRLAVGIAAACAAYGFLKDAIRKYQLNSYVLEASYEVPDWPGYFTLPVGFGLMAAFLFFRVAESFCGAQDPQGDHDEPARSQ